MNTFFTPPLRFLIACLAAAIFAVFIAGISAVHASQNTGGTCNVTLLKNRDYYTALTRAIDKAENEIIMAVFIFKTAGQKESYPDVVAEKLAGAARRGVRVAVILERSKEADSDLDADNNKTAQLLKDKGIKVCFDSPQKTTHTKLVVIDRRLTFAGSHNLTQSALKYNNEVSVIIASETVAAEAHRYATSLCP